MLDLKKECNNLFKDEFILNDTLFPCLFCCTHWDLNGESISQKNVHGVNVQVYLCHSADGQNRGVSEGY